MENTSLLTVLEQTCNQDEYIFFLRERANRCCCKYCGGTLEVRRLTYSNCAIARLELYCNQCGRIEFGTERAIYQRANYVVTETGFDYYPDLNSGLQKQQMNVAKVCELTSWMLGDLDLLDDNGFRDKETVERSVHNNSSIFEEEL